jgi:hypothetical protein
MSNSLYELEKQLEILDMVVKLLAGHTPEMFTRKALNEATAARMELRQYIAEEKEGR